MKKKILLLSALLISTGSYGASLRCHEAPDTLINTCIAPSETRVNGDIRSSPLYMGGPKAIKKTNFTAVANCPKKILTLQDRDGSNFSGGTASSTRAAATIIFEMCSVEKPKTDKTIRMF